MKNKKTNQQGISILGILLLTAVVVLVLSYFNISLKDVVESPKAQENLEYVQEGSRTVWDKYLKDPATYLWQDVWVRLFWRPFIDNMERIIDGKPTDFDKASSAIQVENYSGRNR
jgi:hypothetical protein